MTPTPNSPTLAPPRITKEKFKSLLKTKNSPAVPESDIVYQTLQLSAVDVSFALAQFRVESQYGTAGYAKETGSWGNMLWDPILTTHASGKLTKTTSSGAQYTYATYANYHNAIIDYCTYIHWYISEYGLDTIYGATARWIGKNPGSSGHQSYVTAIINDMIEYEYPQGGYESGDEMIYFGPSLDRNKGQLTLKYPVSSGLQLYRGANESFPLKEYSGTAGKAWWIGFVNGGKAWGAIVIGTTVADADATIVYIKNPDSNKITAA